MSTVANFTLAQYERMVESGAFAGKNHKRVEFIRGEIREMSPIGIGHCAIVDLLNRWSTDHLSAEQAVIRIQGTLRIPATESAPEPDVQWLRPRSYIEGHPEPEDVFLVIEVAETSLEGDLGEKALLYAEAGIADYWVVNIDDEEVVVFRGPTPTGYQSRASYRGDAEISSLAFPEVSLTPAALFPEA